MKIIKRDSAEEDFDSNKIVVVAAKADTAAGKNKLSLRQVKDIAGYAEYKCVKLNRVVPVGEIQDMVENQIMSTGIFEPAKDYVGCRYQRSLARKTNITDNCILPLIECNNEDVKQENSNKNPTVNSMQRDHMAGEVSKDPTKRMLLPRGIVEVDKEGIIRFHDFDHSTQHMRDHDLMNLEDMLQNGTVISEIRIEKLHNFSTAYGIATQIIVQVAGNQYGRQSIGLAHLTPFVDVSRKKTYAEVQEKVKTFGCILSKEAIHEVVEDRLRKEVTEGVQTTQYQIIALMTTNGQAPFLTVFMYLSEAKNEQEKKGLAMIIEETLKQHYQRVKNESGVWITPTFPKLIYVLGEGNTNKGTEYYYLTEMATKCTAKRLVSDYISEKKMMELKEGNYFPVTGCRSALSPQKGENGNYKFYSRSSQGVVTINLMDVALSSGGDIKALWKILDERLDLCYRTLMCYHNRLRGTLSDIASTLWQSGVLARLKKGETISRFLYGGYSIISLGYAGLYECVKYMTGKSRTDQETIPFVLEVMEHMDRTCNRRKDETNIGFDIYGSPMESTTYKFAKCLQKRFGAIEGVTDRSYITSSYHVNVSEEIDVFSKLKFESQFQAPSMGEAISYVKIPNMQSDIPAVLRIIRCICNNVIYVELNIKSDLCQECGFDGEIQIVMDESDKLAWERPKCGNRDEDKLSAAGRTCGHTGTQF